MKKGTEYAKKLKTAYAKFRNSGNGDAETPATEPVEQMIVAVLSQEASVEQGKKALAALQEEMVDYNELRVSTPGEIADVIGNFVPHSVPRAKMLLQLLNAVYTLEYTVSLESLRSKGVRETKQYLDSLEGTTPYVTASIMLWSLGGHAIPVNDTSLAWLVREELVDPDAAPAEVQSFLERHISAADAKSFTVDLEAQAQAAGSRSGGSKSTKSKAAKSSSSKTTKRKTKSSRTSGGKRTSSK